MKSSVRVNDERLRRRDMRIAELREQKAKLIAQLEGLQESLFAVDAGTRKDRSIPEP